jgi:hypothetical protein
MSDLEALRAEVRKFAVQEDCHFCEGSGKHVGDDSKNCPRCKGSGKIASFFPFVVKDMKFPEIDKIFNALSFGPGEVGDWVSVRLANDADKNTYLGIYLGDWAGSFAASINHSTGELVITAGLGNPAIYVPDLKKIVRGYECWWGLIKGPDDLQQITDQTIQNVWYVRALKELSEPSTTQEGE